ncbi:MAG: ABC transporter ATP-binding protein [Ruminiclostridium sp.]|nr:ABC transporter ATP-binding protein [Ruminiclostridium sp.]
MKRLKKDLKILSRGYKIIFSIDTMLISLNVISAILEAVYPFIIIYMGAEILNALSRGDNLNHIYFLLAITLVSNFLTQQIKQFVARTINVKNQIFEHKFLMLLNNKTLDMDYGSIENPGTHIKRQRIDDIRRVGGGGIWKLVYQSRDAVSGIFTVITSIAVTYKAFFIYNSTPQNNLIDIITSPLSSIILLVFIAVNTWITIYFNTVSTEKTHKTWDEAVTQNRVLVYILAKYINTYHAGKDIRLYNQKQMITAKYDKTLDNFVRIFSKMERNQIKYTNINTVMSSVIEWIVYIFIGIRAIYGLIGLGDLFKYITAINQFSRGLTEFLNSFNALRVNNQYLEVLYEFLDIPNEKYHGTLTTEKRADNDYELEFHNVSFRYPGTETYALKNLNLKFNIGQHTAVVGMNGSGKTTMIKLLCRLYDPTEGEITLNGIDIKKYEYAEYLNIFSVVFQDFKLFSFPLGQNVAASVDYDNTQAEKCLEMAGFKDRYKEMQKGLDTPIYKDFEEDGIEISGGEAQKIALARALYKDAPFIVLDEPTAALDPIAEFEIYSKFNQIVGDKTAVYISHRLSSCRFCDDIAVFHEGELIQRGNHDSLLSDKDGKYYELWNAQAQYYNDKAV